MILGIDCSRYDLEKPTGVEIYTDRIVEGVLKKADGLGYDEVRLYTKNADQVEKLLFLAEEYKQGTVKVKLIDHKWLWTLLWLTWGEVFRNKVDALFVPSHILPLVIPNKTIWTVHGIEAVSFPKAYSWFQRNHQQFALNFAKKKGVKIIAVSKAVRNDLVKKANFEKDSIEVVYNGYDSQVPSVKTQVSKEERKHLVEGDFILNVGRLEERKNQLRLVKAFKSIVAEKENKKLKLVLVGPDGNGADEIREYVEKSEWRESIYLTGYQEREMVQDLMKRAKVFAFPSLAEGFGIPILEAFESELPVLTSKGSATEEVAGKAAVLCDPLLVESIEEGLRLLLSSRKLRKEKIEAGKLRVDDFSWAKCVDETLKLLKID